MNGIFNIIDSVSRFIVNTNLALMYTYYRLVKKKRDNNNNNNRFAIALNPSLKNNVLKRFDISQEGSVSILCKQVSF